ncbi:hypothetical protein V5735_04285 (plasmid) [Haladaptatus sp. SPP-AMP-3]|uniref:hypothetical protein n=1 Tax=Haladaptatus sp. SPP-AMP-3 TaxID=3121295 RepID=UPI003C2B5002
MIRTLRTLLTLAVVATMIASVGVGSVAATNDHPGCNTHSEDKNPNCGNHGDKKTTDNSQRITDGDDSNSVDDTHVVIAGNGNGPGDDTVSDNGIDQDNTNANAGDDVNVDS